MKGIDFLDIVGEIDEHYILEAEQKKIVQWNYKQFVSIAASFTVICTLSFAGYQYFHPTAGATADMTREMAGADAMDAYGINTIGDMDQTTTIEEKAESTDEISTGLEVEDNIFQEIIQNIVSFFKSLRF